MLVATFYYLALASVTSALLAVTRKNPVHAMLWVLALFLHVAGIFVLLGAEFLAAVQVIVYAGAILIFYLFVVFAALMIDRGDGSLPSMGSSHAVRIDAGSGVATQVSSIEVKAREI